MTRGIQSSSQGIVIEDEKAPRNFFEKLPTLFPGGDGRMQRLGGRVPPTTMTDETATLDLAFPGHLLCAFLASQVPEIVKPCRRTKAHHPCSRTGLEG
jgi:hypothetical protein